MNSLEAKQWLKDNWGTLNGKELANALNRYYALKKSEGLIVRKTWIKTPKPVFNGVVTIENMAKEV
jgi:hypothetical protein